MGSRHTEIVVDRRDPAAQAPRERSPAPNRRLGRASATILPRSCCSIRAPARPRPEPSSAGIRPIQRSSTSSATEATAR